MLRSLLFGIPTNKCLIYLKHSIFSNYQAFNDFNCLVKIIQIISGSTNSELTVNIGSHRKCYQLRSLPEPKTR